ncbi:MAG: hypothetical protein ACE15D_18855 [Candidatus Eisenbacteria bacterium]
MSDFVLVPRAPIDVQITNMVYALYHVSCRDIEATREEVIAAYKAALSAAPQPDYERMSEEDAGEVISDAVDDALKCVDSFVRGTETLTLAQCVAVASAVESEVLRRLGITP